MKQDHNIINQMKCLSPISEKTASTGCPDGRKAASML